MFDVVGVGADVSTVCVELSVNGSGTNNESKVERAAREFVAGEGAESPTTEEFPRQEVG